MPGGLYRRIEGRVLPEGCGVLHWQENGGEAVHFRCPCDKRYVYVTSPPHSIEFSEDGTLASVGGSCGSKANERKGRPSNWCHFTITDGLAKMYEDAKCPGGDGSIP